MIKFSSFQVWYFDGWSGDDCSLISHLSCNRNPNPKKHSRERRETLVLTDALGNKAPVHSEWPWAVSGLHPAKPPSCSSVNPLPIQRRHCPLTPSWLEKSMPGSFPCQSLSNGIRGLTSLVLLSGETGLPPTVSSEETHVLFHLGRYSRELGWQIL